MTPPANGVINSSIKLVFAGLAVFAIIFGGSNLLINLPCDFYPYFWDGANLLLDVSEDDFITAGSGSSYALRKFGYAVPVHYLVKWLGFPGVLVVNLFWFVVMLSAGNVVFVRRRRWFGALAFSAGMICLPFTHKYIGMANPTIQAMALWLILFCTYRRSPLAVLRSTLLPGLLVGLLILTDFPKWALVVIPTILLIELVITPLFDGRSLSSMFVHGIKRVFCIFTWGVLPFGIAALVNPNLIQNNIIRVLSIDLPSFDSIRPGLSGNFPLFLWILGGAWLILYILLFWRWTAPFGLRKNPTITMPLIIVAVFSLLLWPRNARMFAMVMPMSLFIFGHLADTVLHRGFHGAMIKVAAIASVGIIAGFALRAPYAGECWQLPTGVREVNHHIADNPEIPPDIIMGTYFGPSFRLSVAPGYDWIHLDTYYQIDMNWAVTGDFIDEVLIDERIYGGSKSEIWRESVISFRYAMLDQPEVAVFPNDFYASKWYLVESNFDDGRLVFMLRQAVEIQKPHWRLRCIGGLFGRERPMPNEN